MRVLAADIGGTKTLLALAGDGAPGARIESQRRFDSAAFDTFEAMLDEFLRTVSPSGRPPIQRACLAVAGPISADGKTAKVTNLSWGVEIEHIQREFAVDSVLLINDFEAQAYGAVELPESELTILQPGRPRHRALRLVMGAGTGLGVCQLVWCRDHYEACPSEGGHADFAPNGGMQRDLLAWLQDLYGHVSVERLLSGSGLLSIYRFLAVRFPDRASSILDGVDEIDAPAAISRFALSDHPDDLARDALDLFVSIYGAHAGSLALVTLPYGGIYIAGGIAPAFCRP